MIFLILPLLIFNPVFAVTLIAHRGVHHTYGPKMDNGCRSYLNQRHPFVENTLESIQRAFELGADKVEIDLMVTKDEKVFLFHDENLKCHLGVDKNSLETSWSEVSSSDPGFGITFDEGKTYPLRSKGFKIPLLGEVFAHFPHKAFLLNPKIYSPVITREVIRNLKKIPAQQREKFWVWGNRKTFEEINAYFPEVSNFVETPDQYKQCLDDYFSAGWYGEFPASCRNRHISLGADQWWKIWDFPFPFLLKAQENKLKVSLWLGNRTTDTSVYENLPLEGIILSNIDLHK